MNWKSRIFEVVLREGKLYLCHWKNKFLIGQFWFSFEYLITIFPLLSTFAFRTGYFFERKNKGFYGFSSMLISIMTVPHTFLDRSYIQIKSRKTTGYLRQEHALELCWIFSTQIQDIYFHIFISSYRQYLTNSHGIKGNFDKNLFLSFLIFKVWSRFRLIISELTNFRHPSFWEAVVLMVSRGLSDYNRKCVMRVRGITRQYTFAIKLFFSSFCR